MTMRKRSGQKGVVLALVAVVLAVLAILAVAVMGVGSADQMSSIRQGREAQAQYLARSGAEAMGDYLRQNPAMLATLNGKTSSHTMLEEGDTGYFVVTVRNLTNTVELVSTATIASTSKTLTLVLSKPDLAPKSWKE
jgi:hypothetical protein